MYRCEQIHQWEPIPPATLRAKYPGKRFYSDQDPLRRRHVNLEGYPLLDTKGLEIPIFDSSGNRIPRRTALVFPDEPPCGVLMNLKDIQSLFNPGDQGYSEDELIEPTGAEANPVNIDAYPLGFLRVAGNVQATGVPHCFYPIITEINRAVRRTQNRSSPESDEDTFAMDLDTPCFGAQVVTAVSSQFYNYIAHRIATRAGRLDSQQGSVTAALSGAFSQTTKDRATAYTKQAYCDRALPSDRFHRKIHRPECPTSCRAEFVYSVDVRALRDQSGMYAATLISCLLPFNDCLQVYIQQHHPPPCQILETAKSP